MSPYKTALLQRFAAGLCTREEREQVLEYLQTPEGRRHMRTVMDAEEDCSSDVEAALDSSTSDRIFRHIEARLQEQQGMSGLRSSTNRSDRETVSPSDRAPARSRRRTANWPFAAVMLLALVTGATLLHLQPNLFAFLPSSGSVEVVTAAGEQRTIRLADGTNVHINERSRLVYPEDFGGQALRVVELEGEGQFDVASDPGAPFLIHTSAAEVHVVGTAFDVHTRRASEGRTAHVIVAVEEGAVALRRRGAADSSRVLLVAGEVGIVSAQGIARHTSLNVANYRSWATGHLTFTDAPLADVARQIEHLYDVRVVLEDADLGALQLTARMERGPLSYVLREITNALDIRYSQKGRTMHLTKE